MDTDVCRYILGSIAYFKGLEYTFKMSLTETL